mmetsp:Transcript_941/g.1992  ORF Transcript_941/g.1992 Transcript_941/m.1992 type:complete len:240 (+) Transcript_941:118-837(+)
MQRTTTPGDTASGSCAPWAAGSTSSATAPSSSTTTASTTRPGTSACLSSKRRAHSRIPVQCVRSSASRENTSRPARTTPRRGTTPSGSSRRVIVLRTRRGSPRPVASCLRARLRASPPRPRSLTCMPLPARTRWWRRLQPSVGPWLRSGIKYGASTGRCARLSSAAAAASGLNRAQRPRRSTVSLQGVASASSFSFSLLVLRSGAALRLFVQRPETTLRSRRGSTIAEQFSAHPASGRG